MRIPFLTKKQPARGPQVRDWSAPREPHPLERDASRFEAEAPGPQPERHEPELHDPRFRDLSNRDYKAILIRAAKEAKDDGIQDVAAALAYYGFLSIPALLLVSVGIFSLVASPDAITTIVEKLRGVVPGEAITLLEENLRRVIEEKGGARALVGVGGLVALWTASSAANALMRGLNTVYDRKETRGFVKQRLTALAILAAGLVAIALVVGLLVLGPILSDWVGDLVGLESVFHWIWWTVQWPILIGGLLLAFAAILYLGPNIDHPRWEFLTPGSVVAVAVWLLASGGFALYVSLFGSYNKTWGSVAAVVIMLTWLWVSGLALLFGAEINSETERSRELRQGKPAERELTAPAKA